MGCVPLPDTGGAAVSEKRCGNRGYENNMTVISARMKRPRTCANRPGIGRLTVEREST